MKTFNWLFVGCGGIAATVGKDLRGSDNKIYAVYGRNPAKAEAFAKKFHCKAYSDLEELNELEKAKRNEFPDMKEWKGNRYTGIGIKKMKGYKCTLPIDKLNEKRNEFWSSKQSEDPVQRKMWRVINQACVYDECNIINLLFYSNFR